MSSTLSALAEEELIPGCHRQPRYLHSNTDFYHSNHSKINRLNIHKPIVLLLKDCFFGTRQEVLAKSSLVPHKNVSAGPRP